MGVYGNIFELAVIRDDRPSQKGIAKKALARVDGFLPAVKKIVFATMAQTVMNQPTRIEHGKLRCLILDAPTNENVDVYIKEMQDFGVTDLVRTCELTYDERLVESAGILTHEMVFGDGEAPTDDILLSWLELVNTVGGKKGALGVHCVAGLGRAPVLVAVALVERGMDPLDAIAFIRDRRKGAINRRQLQYLRNYKRRSRSDKRCCAVM